MERFRSLEAERVASVDSDRSADPDWRADRFGWAERAGVAESAVVHRFLGRVWNVPGTALGSVRSPGRTRFPVFGPWNFWWQAHLLDVAVDALERAGGMARARRVTAIVAGIRLRNGVLWRNKYLDDLAWLGLALQRAGTLAGLPGRRAVAIITARLRAAWIDDGLGGLPWRRGDEFRNAPANGPAAILLARRGFPDEAERIAEWLHARLTRPDGLIADGIRPGGRVEPTAYTYNQGVVLGCDLTLLPAGRGSPDRISRLVTAVDAGLTQPADAGQLGLGGRVLIGHGAGDGGLFGGILARYLALVATELPGRSEADRSCRATAGRLVLDSAAAAWAHRGADAAGPWFSADWSVPARLPTPAGRGTGRGSGSGTGAIGPAAAEQDLSAARDLSGQQDLSVQLGGWMLLEAAARVEASPPR